MASAWAADTSGGAPFILIQVGIVMRVSRYSAASSGKLDAPFSPFQRKCQRSWLLGCAQFSFQQPTKTSKPNSELRVAPCAVATLLFAVRFEQNHSLKEVKDGRKQQVLVRNSPNSVRKALQAGGLNRVLKSPRWRAPSRDQRSGQPDRVDDPLFK